MRTTWRGFTLGAACVLACTKGGSPSPDAAVPSPASPGLEAARRAEGARNLPALSPDLERSPHREVRRAVARAIARIGGEQATPRLVRLLHDEDSETAAWAAYGLGFDCRSDPEATTRTLAARALTTKLDAENAELRLAIARGIGRCAMPAGEEMLAAWTSNGGWAQESVYGLGDMAGRKKALSERTVRALLAANERMGALALFPLSRVTSFPDATLAEIRTASTGAMSVETPARIFAVRTLARSNATSELTNVATNMSHSVAERSEAARALATPANASGLEATLTALTEEASAADFTTYARSGRFNVLYTLLSQWKKGVPSNASSAALLKLVDLRPAGDLPIVPLRAARLRCEAARLLAKGDASTDALRSCADASSVAREQALVGTLEGGLLRGKNLAIWNELLGSPHAQVRERALELVGEHPELGERGKTAVVEAFEKDDLGLVTTAAELVTAHPERLMVLAASERKRALDPSAPAPTIGETPRKEVDTGIARSLRRALAHPWPDDAIETRAALVDAAVTLGIPEARAAAMAGCRSPNATLRERAKKALRLLGDKVECPALNTAPSGPEDPSAPASTRWVLETDAGKLTLVVDERSAPMHRRRLSELARKHFFDKLLFHRVVPGFVAQFGDPNGDGYGGSGMAIPCETSLRAFVPNTIGMALGGRDTGSSQMFVTLAWTPHLDGDYTVVGHAEGPWEAIAEGDAIQSVRVE